MGYLMMCALSAWAGRSGRCVLPFLSPRGTLSTWCVERAVAAATRQGVPRARLRDRVVDLLRVVMRPSEPVANERAGRRRTHAAAWRSGRPGSLLTLAPHRSGRAGCRDRSWARAPVGEE